MAASPEPTVSARRPFPGLRPFDSRDRAFFFGRQEQIYGLYRLMEQARFISVVGSSGSGKSSLVRAGLLPLLDEESAGAGGRTWLWRVMHPAGAPLSRLTNLLASLSKDDDPIVASGRRERIASYLRRSSFGIADTLAETSGLDKVSLLLVVDQFEELFRYEAPSTGRTRDRREEALSRNEAAQFVQLLLEAGRSRARNVTVLLTMRSDFIGDCARFHGLPEAVSAVQFLVPSLTRDQLDEVIRAPILEAGATIEPVLVERLLNDISDEPDQLPVLQHCLLRLWDRAGADIGDGPAGATPTGDPTGAPVGAPAGAVRHVNVGHYDAIGRIDGALSQHANEILSGLPGATLAAEQVFRMLAEIDKQGRAIRRALPFEQLEAETGVPEQDVRRVVDRFRTEDCSFLLPPPSEVSRLEPQTRIDVGHEALLRRWRQVSGTTGDPSADAIGWLRAEQLDGQRYATLLSMAESEGGERPILPAELAKSRWQWWRSRPRTRVWAERYGGGFDRVERLLTDSLKAMRTRSLLIWATAVGAFVLVAVAAAEGYQTYQTRLDADNKAAQAERNFRLALNMANKFLDQVLRSFNDGAITVKGGKDLIKTSEDIVGEVQAQSPSTKALRVKLLLTKSDLLLSVGDRQRALATAQLAQRLAGELVAVDSGELEWQQFVFESAFRIGDAAPSMALEQFRQAQTVAAQWAVKMPESDAWQAHLAFIDGKVGETLQSRRDYPGALQEFKDSLDISRKLSAKTPGKREWKRNVASTLAKIAAALANKPDPDLAGALARYQEAIAIQTDLRQAPAEDDADSLQSNLAFSHRGKAEVLVKMNDLEGAIQECRDAVTLREGLLERDPSNAVWLEYLAPDYARLGDALKERGDMAGAILQYQNELKTRQKLVDKDPTNSQWQHSLDGTRQKLANLQPPQP